MTFFKIIFALLLVIGLYNCVNAGMDLYLTGGVYACGADRGNMPPQIEQQCQRLTKGQWWHK
jgi:hypothetical protein